MTTPVLNEGLRGSLSLFALGWAHRRTVFGPAKSPLPPHSDFLQPGVPVPSEIKRKIKFYRQAQSPVPVFGKIKLLFN